MKKVSKIIFILLGVTTLNSCTKETYTGDKFIPIEKNLKDEAK